MPTLTSIIFLSPGTDLSPISTLTHPKFTLPILNTPLLLHNLRWVSPISTFIYLIYIDKYKQKVQTILKEFEHIDKIILVEREHYDGTFQNLKELVKNVQSSDILISKGDIITSIKLEKIYNIYLQERTNFFSILKKDEANLSIIGYHKNDLLFYSDDPNTLLPKQFFFDHKKCTFSKEYDTSQVYIVKKKYLEKIEGDFFSLKSNLFPYLIDISRQSTPVRFFYSSDDFFQVQKYSDLLNAIHFLRDKTKNLPFYLHDSEIEENDPILREKLIKNYNLQNINFIYKSKKRISFQDDKNVVGRFSKIENAKLKKTIIGNNCTIGTDSVLVDSILFNNVFVGKNCELKGCLVGNNVRIEEGLSFIDCRITGDYVFHEAVHAINRVFIKR